MMVKDMKDWAAAICIVLALGGVVIPAQLVPMGASGVAAYAQQNPNSGLGGMGDEDWSGRGCSMTFHGCDADGDGVPLNSFADYEMSYQWQHRGPNHPFYNETKHLYEGATAQNSDGSLMSCGELATALGFTGTLLAGAGGMVASAAQRNRATSRGTIMVPHNVYYDSHGTVYYGFRTSEGSNVGANDAVGFALMASGVVVTAVAAGVWITCDSDD